MTTNMFPYTVQEEYVYDYQYAGSSHSDAQPQVYSAYYKWRDIFYMQLRHLLLSLFFAMQAEDDPELNEVDFVDDTPSENKVRYTIFLPLFTFQYLIYRLVF